MKIFLYISDDLFDKSLAFLNDLKARNLEAFVFSTLKEEHQKIVLDLGFTFVDGNPYEVLAQESGQSTLVSSFDHFLPAPFGTLLSEGIVCRRSSISLENIVLPINNIYQRANVANLLENDLLAKLGNLLSTEYISAPKEFWSSFNEIYKRWIQDDFVEKVPGLHDLVFNFCVAFLGRTHLIKFLG